MKVNKSQAILVFALLIVFVAAALVIMAPYIGRKVQGSYKQAADTFGTGITGSGDSSTPQELPPTDQGPFSTNNE